MRILSLVILFAGNSQAQPPVNIEMMAVAYEFKIGKYEVAIGRYTTFFYAVDAKDTYSLDKANMATDLNVAGITQAGSSGSFACSVTGSGNRPISSASWYDAARFANWLHNSATAGGMMRR